MTPDSDSVHCVDMEVCVYSTTTDDDDDDHDDDDDDDDDDEGW